MVGLVEEPKINGIYLKVSLIKHLKDFSKKERKDNMSWFF
jgi:hypothetical protein